MKNTLKGFDRFEDEKNGSVIWKAGEWKAPKGGKKNLKIIIE